MRKRILIPVFMAIVFCAGLISSTFGSDSEGILRHVVSFKFKKSATPESIRQVEQAFRELEDKIPAIISFEMGTTISNLSS